MRLLISSSLFYPSRLGGPANTLYWLSKGLIKEGVDVSVITTDGEIQPGQVLSDCWTDVDGIQVLYCKRDRHPILNMLRNTWKTINSYDAVMLCDMFQPQILGTAFLAKIKHKPIVWSARGELLSSAISSNFFKRVYLKIVNLFFGTYAHFHATSDDEKAAMEVFFPKAENISVIPNFMEIPVKQDRMNVGNPFLVYLGRIAPIKAIDRLIEGLALSKKFRESEFVFKIAGGVEKQFDEYHNNLLKKVNKLGLTKKVDFIGPVSGIEKYQLYANAYAMFLVSHSENFGNVIIESLSQGTPVVASKGTPWEQLAVNNAGYWISNEPIEIANTIDLLLSLKIDEYNALRRRAFEYGESFDVYKNAYKWKVLVNGICIF